MSTCQTVGNFWVTDVSRTVTFPDRRFPDKTLVVGFHGLTRISPKNFHLTSILPLF